MAGAWDVALHGIVFEVFPPVPYSWRSLGPPRGPVVRLADSQRRRYRFICLATSAGQPCGHALWRHDRAGVLSSLGSVDESRRQLRVM